MVWELLSSLMELQGFTAPMKWTTFALWPNLQEQSCDSCMCYGLALCGQLSGKGMALTKEDTTYLDSIEQR